MKKKVLLIEDTPVALDNLRELLEMEGIEVITASNGHEALDKLYMYKPDLIMTDLRMPKMDGFKFIETVKKSAELSSIPVIVFSANATPENEKKCLALGALQFIKKPCPTDALLEAIHSALA